MNRIMTLALVLLCVLAVACTATQPTIQNPLPTTTSAALPVKSGTLRLEVPADADVADIPWLMAVDLLKEQGYTIETVSFASSHLEPAAMSQGDLDIASISNQVAWAAVSKGALNITFIDKHANTFMAITRKDIQTCADLVGKSVAIAGVSTVSGAMFDAYLERNCPDVKPEIVIVKGGSNRMAALLTGSVDVALQDVDDLIKIEREKPGQFHALTVFSQEFPGLQISSHVVRREFAEQHPEMVKDVIRALFAARRSIQDPQVLREAVIKYLDLEPDKAQQIAETYLAQKIWDASGVYTLEMVQATLDFLQEYGDLPPGLKAEDVADLSYYEAVLDEIGRQ
jgi:NitT/TauT family transport system substrate-binding protein